MLRIKRRNSDLISLSIQLPRNLLLVCEFFEKIKIKISVALTFDHDISVGVLI